MKKFKKKNPGKLAGVSIIAALMPYLFSMVGWFDTGLILATILLLISSFYLLFEKYLSF